MSQPNAPYTPAVFKPPRLSRFSKRALQLAMVVNGLTACYKYGEQLLSDKSHGMAHESVVDGTNIKAVRDSTAKHAPDINARLASSKKMPRHFVMASPLTNAAGFNTHFTTANQQGLIDDFKAFDEHKNFGEIVFAATKHYEGCQNKMYKDSEGLPTIGVGFLLPKPGTDPEREKIVRSLGLNYKKLCNGSQKITDEQAKSLTLIFINQKNGLRDQLEGEIKGALNFNDDKTARAGWEDKYGKDNLSADMMDPRYKALMLTMMYQAPNVMSRHGKKSGIDHRDVFYPMLRVLCNKEVGSTDRVFAMQGIIQSYQDLILLKSHRDDSFAKSNRLNLADRASSVMSVAMKDSRVILPADMLASKLVAARRDAGDKTLIVAGDLPEDGLYGAINSPLFQLDEEAAFKAYDCEHGLTYARSDNEILVQNNKGDIVERIAIDAHIRGNDATALTAYQSAIKGFIERATGIEKPKSADPTLAKN